MNIFINKIYKNSKLLVDIKKIGCNNHLKYIDEIGNSFYSKELQNIQIECNSCKNKFLFLFKKRYINKLYICHSCSIKGNKNPFYGKHHSKESKKKMGGCVNDYSGKNNPMYNRSVYDVWVKKYGIDIANEKLQKQIEKISKINTGKNNGMYGKSVYDVWVGKYGVEVADKKMRDMKKKISNYENLPDVKERKRQRILKWMESGKSFRETIPEKIIKSILIDFKINFKQNKHFGNYNYDFYIENKNILIEVQGDYWHGNPKFFGNGAKKRKLNERQLFKKNRDVEKATYAKNINMKVIYFWEYDIKNNIEKIKKIIKNKIL